MTATPQDEPGFETDVNELPEGTDRSEHTMEESGSSDDDAATGMEEAQKDAAEERKEGGYQ